MDYFVLLGETLSFVNSDGTAINASPRFAACDEQRISFGPKQLMTSFDKAGNRPFVNLDRPQSSRDYNGATKPQVVLDLCELLFGGQHFVSLDADRAVIGL